MDDLWHWVTTWWYAVPEHTQAPEIDKHEFIFSLPLDVWHEILRRLDDEEVKYLACVNKEWQMLVTDDGLWQRRFVARRPSNYPKAAVMKKFNKMVSMHANCSWQELCTLDTELKFIPFNVEQSEIEPEVKEWIDSLWCCPRAFRSSRINEQSMVFIPVWCFTVDAHINFKGKVLNEPNSVDTDHTFQSVQNIYSLATTDLPRPILSLFSGRTANRFLPECVTALPIYSAVDLDDDNCAIVKATVPFQQAWSRAIREFHKSVQSFAIICEQYLKKEYFRQHPEKGFIRLNLTPEQNPDTYQNANQHEHQNQPANANVATRAGRHLNLQNFEVVHTRATDITLNDVHKNASALFFLPFYLIKLKYGNQTFHLLLNGITRKIHGERPWSWGKMILMALSLPFSLPLYYIWNMFFSYDYFPKKLDSFDACIQEVK